MEQNEARLNITFGGQNGDLPDPIPADAGNNQILQWATEAVRSGTVPGLAASETADFSDFIVDRFEANENRPYNLVQIRPKTPFGG